MLMITLIFMVKLILDMSVFKIIKVILTLFYVAL